MTTDTGNAVHLIPSPKYPTLVADEMLRARGWRAEEVEDGITRDVLQARVQREQFYVWERGVYRPLTNHELAVAVTAFTRTAFYMGASGVEPWNPTTRNVNEVVTALMRHPDLQLPPNLLAPSWLLGEDRVTPIPAHSLVAVENGLVDVMRREGGTRVVWDHTPELWNRVRLPIKYSGHAVTPTRWFQFLDEVWPDDPESIRLLQQVFGYIVSGRTDLQKAFAIIGPKRSGKGTIARVLSGLVGHDAYASTTMSNLARNFGLQGLIDKSLAVISDARVDRRGASTDAVERILSITGEDFVNIDIKFRAPISVQLPTRFMVLTNEMPRLPDASGALASRFVFLPMTRSFFGKEDTYLTQTLMAELPGILDWALDGLEDLQHLTGSFLTTAAGARLGEEMADLGSPVRVFVNECCVLDPDAAVETSVLYDAWRVWASENGHLNTNIGTFGRDLKAAFGIERKRMRVSKARPSLWRRNGNSAGNEGEHTAVKSLGYAYPGIDLKA